MILPFNISRRSASHLLWQLFIDILYVLRSHGEVEGFEGLTDLWGGSQESSAPTRCIREGSIKPPRESDGRVSYMGTVAGVADLIVSSRPERSLKGGKLLSRVDVGRTGARWGDEAVQGM